MKKHGFPPGFEYLAVHWFSNRGQGDIFFRFSFIHILYLKIRGPAQKVANRRKNVRKWEQCCSRQGNKQGGCSETQRLINWPIKSVPRGKPAALAAPTAKKSCLSPHLVGLLVGLGQKPGAVIQPPPDGAVRKLSETALNKWRTCRLHPNCHCQLAARN